MISNQESIGQTDQNPIPSQSHYDSNVPILNFESCDELAAIERSFQAIRKLSSRFERLFWLHKVASFHGFGKAEFRRLYEVWVLEVAIEGGQADE